MNLTCMENIVFWNLDLFLAAICLLQSYLRQNHQTISHRKKIRISILTRKNFVAELICGSPTISWKHFFMDQRMFTLLCSNMKDTMLLEESMNVYIEEIIMACVYILAIGASNRTYNFDFNTLEKQLVGDFMRFLMLCIAWHINIYISAKANTILASSRYNIFSWF